MNKLTAVFAVISILSSALAAGLWFSRPEDNTAQIVALETKLREAQAAVARLTKERVAIQAASPGSVAGFGANAASSAISASSLPASTPIPPSAGSADAAATPSTAAGAPIEKTDKRLAEAEARYADIINQFNLQPEEKEAFKKMLASRDDIRKDASSKLMDPSLTTAQRQAILAAGKQQLNQVDDSIKQFLNSDADFATFQKSQNQELERNQLESGRAIFQNGGVPLSTDQESWLIDQMYALRKDTKGLGDPYYLETMAGVRMDSAYVQNSLNKFDNDTNILLANARTQMGHAQLEALRSMRVQLRVQMESRLWNLSRTTGGQ